MEKKLAIKGHPTRGNKVIEILKMMGGKNHHNLNGLFSENAYYFIGGPHNDEILGGEYMFGNENIYWFTLEEFLKKYPFKIGDKVRIPEYESEVQICKMRWDQICHVVEYLVYRNNDEEWYTTDELLEYNAIDLVEKHYQEQCGEMLKNITLKHISESGMVNINEIPSFELMFKINDELRYKIPDGYEISEVSKDKVYIKPIKSKYPTTYEECLVMTSYDKEERILHLLEKFKQLFICRDAYWKIAGEKLELGKPWKPDWDSGKLVYCISVSGNTIGKGKWYTDNKILAFPTEEMRDAFYENFKELIEQCKELL